MAPVSKYNTPGYRLPLSLYIPALLLPAVEPVVILNRIISNLVFFGMTKGKAHKVLAAGDVVETRQAEVVRF